MNFDLTISKATLIQAHDGCKSVRSPEDIIDMPITWKKLPHQITTQAPNFAQVL